MSVSWHAHEVELDVVTSDVYDDPKPSSQSPGVFVVILVGLISLVSLCCCFTCRRGNLAKYVMDPRRSSYKYALLFCIVLFIPGPYFHDGLLACFKAPISESMQLSNSEFASLFAVSSFTGVLLAPGGAVIARIGRTPFAVGASFAAALGSTIVTVGCYLKLLFLMLIGRFIFWLALNGLIMVQTILVYDLFKGDGLNGAMTFIVCSIRLGGSLAYFLSGPLLTSLGELPSLWLSVGLVFGAFLATLIFAFLFRGSAISRTIQHPEGRRTARETFSLKLLRQVPLSMYFFLGGLDAAWGVVFPFEVVGVDMMMKDFHYNADFAGVIIAIAPSISICSPLIAPFLGTVLHHKLMACFLGLVFLTCGFLALVFELAIPGVMIIGVGYAVSICSFYSTLPMMVQAQVPADMAKSIETLLVGLNMVGSGLSMIMTNLVIGAIKDGTGSYKGGNVFCFSVAIFGIVSLGLSIAFRRSPPDERLTTSSGEMAARTDSAGSDAPEVIATSSNYGITDEYVPTPEPSFGGALSSRDGDSQMSLPSTRDAIEAQQ